FGEIFFTEDVQAKQVKTGVRDKFQHVYRNRFTGPLDESMRDFTETRTTFYIASNSTSGFPYVQHRGGPAGFLKMIGGDEIGFADYHGNQQEITGGNLVADDRVSLILMDYARQTRLKIVGHMTMVAASEDADLTEKVAQDGQGPVERVARIRVIAVDWNCPKYIEQRFNRDEVSALVAPHLASRDQAIETLSARLAALGEDPKALLAQDKNP
ncbi:MAG: pyridoxamine 5'-phosphate oxidase family protein, partial [Tateyamaria sp.]|uniref:pyridoxamine 5'-phosphate oxidase family protein n=1 Tax=Tateyamaria sp. TaxID=1929288 RepID=UPI0032A04FF8